MDAQSRCATATAKTATGDWRQYTSAFLQHLKTRQRAVAELSALTRTSRCALLCFEADFNFCHRTMVADAVRDRCGAQVHHITGPSVKVLAVNATSSLNTGEFGLA